MILARLPTLAHPKGDIANAKSYTLELAGKSAKIQIVLDKPLYYIKGAKVDVVERLAISFGQQFNMDKSGGVGLSCRQDQFGSYAHAMALAEWAIEVLEAA